MGRLMGRYHNTFYGVKNDDQLTASSFEHIFANSDGLERLDDEGGSIQYIDEESTYSLMILPNRTLGFLVAFSCYDNSIKRSKFCVYSVGDASKMNDIKDVGDEEFYPVGAFVDQSLIWAAIQDFFINPTQPSSAVQWLDESEIDWPEN